MAAMNGIYANNEVGYGYAAAPEETILSIVFDAISTEECIADTLDCLEHVLFGTGDETKNAPINPDNLNNAAAFLRDMANNNRNHLNRLFDQIGGR